MKAHTKGPWWPHKNSAGSWDVRTWRDCHDPETVRELYGDDAGATICTGVGDYTEARTRGNEEVNARLIAKAPDLLEALQDFVSSYQALGSPLPLDREVEVALSVIAKVKGGL